MRLPVSCWLRWVGRTTDAVLGCLWSLYTRSCRDSLRCEVVVFALGERANSFLVLRSDPLTWRRQQRRLLFAPIHCAVKRPAAAPLFSVSSDIITAARPRPLDFQTLLFFSFVISLSFPTTCVALRKEKD